MLKPKPIHPLTHQKFYWELVIGQAWAKHHSSETVPTLMAFLASWGSSDFPSATQGNFIRALSWTQGSHSHNSAWHSMPTASICAGTVIGKESICTKSSLQTSLCQVWVLPPSVEVIWGASSLVKILSILQSPTLSPPPRSPLCIWSSQSSPYPDCHCLPHRTPYCLLTGAPQVITSETPIFFIFSLS